MADGRPNEGERRLPWWLGTGVRLPILLVCLLFAVLVLVRRDGGAEGRAGSPCWGRMPPLAEVGFDGLYMLRGALLGPMKPLGRPYTVGVPEPADAWLDNSPAKFRLARLPDGRWPAAWEMRVWRPDATVVGDVFLFADAAGARSFFTYAASGHCRRDSLVREAPLPRPARDVSWINPVDFRQEDAFVERGAQVFVFRVVRNRSEPDGYQERVGLGQVNALACELADAGCRR
jgi:hypothetical protein